MDSIRERDKQGQYKGKGNAFFFFGYKRLSGLEDQRETQFFGYKRLSGSENQRETQFFGYKRLSGSEDQKETQFCLQKVV